MCLKSNAFGLIEDDSTHPYFRMWSCYRRRCPKDIGMYACRKNEEIGRLTASIAEKDKTIVELTEERETMKARIAELEVQVPSDEKNLPVADSKDLQEEDAKEVTVTDDKAVSVEDEKKTGKGKTSK